MVTSTIPSWIWKDGEVHDLLLRVVTHGFFVVSTAPLSPFHIQTVSVQVHGFSALACVLEVDVEAHPRFLFRLEGRPHFANRHVSWTRTRGTGCFTSSISFRVVSHELDLIVSGTLLTVSSAEKGEQARLRSASSLCDAARALFFHCRTGHVHDLLLRSFTLHAGAVFHAVRVRPIIVDQGHKTKKRRDTILDLDEVPYWLKPPCKSDVQDDFDPKWLEVHFFTVSLVRFLRRSECNADTARH